MIKSTVSTALIVTVLAVPAAAQSDREWSRVRKLEPGTEITVSMRAGPREAQDLARFFVSADNSTLTVLNLTNPALPTAVVGALRELVSKHSTTLQRVATGGTVVISNVRVTSAGVFLDDRQVASLDDVLNIRARSDIVEISRTQKGRGFWGHLGPLGGYFVGGFVGGLVSGLVCQAAAGTDRCDNGAFLVGMTAGGIAGGAYGFHAARRESVEVMYRATE